MWIVVRTSPEGYRGEKEFDTKAAAEDWLASEPVRQDRQYGFHFSLKEE